MLTIAEVRALLRELADDPRHVEVGDDLSVTVLDEHGRGLARSGRPGGGHDR